MRFLVIKAKYIVIAVICAVFLPLCFMYAARTVSVFNVVGREIPIYCVERSDNKIAVTFDCAWNDSDIDARYVQLSRNIFYSRRLGRKISAEPA